MLYRIKNGYVEQESNESEKTNLKKLGNGNTLDAYIHIYSYQTYQARPWPKAQPVRALDTNILNVKGRQILSKVYIVQ